MGTGYVRNDAANNIADGNVINASDLDGEFDAVQAAFNGSTGHSHDGTTGEGPQIDTAGLANSAVTTAKINNDAVTLGTKTSGNYVATGAVSGVGLSGSASAEGATFTVTSNATDANTASTIVARDASGDFSAGTITAALTGTASNAALLDSLDSTQFLRSDAADTKTSGDLSFSDNVKAVFGAGSDLQIYHDNSAGYSVIADVGTGNLEILATDLAIRNADRTATYMGATNGGAVTIRHNGSIKLATTSSGIDVTGTVTADEDVVLTGSGSPKFESVDTTNNVTTRLFSGNTVGGVGTYSNHPLSLISNSTTKVKIEANGDTGFLGGDISFYDNTGVTQGFFWDASTQRLGLGTTAPDALLSLALSGSTGAYFEGGGTADNSDARRLIISASTTTNAGDTHTLNAESSTGNIALATSNTERLRIDEDGNVGIGSAAPSTALEVKTASPIIRSTHSTSGDYLQLFHNGSGAYIDFSADPLIIRGASNAERLRITSGGKVGIGVTPDSELHIDRGQVNIRFGYNNLSENYIDADTQIFRNGGGSEAMRITGGNLLVGKTASGVANTGAELQSSGFTSITRDGGPPLQLNRKTSDGDLFVAKKDGTTVGTIGTASSYIYMANGDTGIAPVGGTDRLLPVNGSGAVRDAAIDMGYSSGRFRDLYLSGDANIDGYVSAEGGNAPNGGFQIKDTGGTLRPRITNDASNATVIRAGSATGNVKFNNFANTTELVNITDSGNFGIGTSSPSSSSGFQARLAVHGTGSPGLILRDTDTAQENVVGTNGAGLYIESAGHATASNNAIIFRTENTNSAFSATERMRITSGGAVGIGTSSPGSLLQVGSTATSNNLITVASANNSTAGIDLMGDLTGAKGFRVKYEGNGNYFAIDDNTSGTLSERMRINSGGRLLVGTTNASPHNISSGTVGGCSFGEDNGGEIATDAYNCFQVNKLSSTSGSLIAFRYNATQVGYISTNGSTTAYNTTSDYRLKENVADMTGAIDRVKALAPKRFNFIADADTTVDGFIAHEAQEVVPEAVTGTHNEVDADGNPVMQGIDQSKLVPLLTGALKEAIAKIEDLETRLSALEGV